MRWREHHCGLWMRYTLVVLLITSPTFLFRQIFAKSPLHNHTAFGPSMFNGSRPVC